MKKMLYKEYKALEVIYILDGGNNAGAHHKRRYTCFACSKGAAVKRVAYNSIQGVDCKKVFDNKDLFTFWICKECIHALDAREKTDGFALVFEADGLDWP